MIIIGIGLAAWLALRAYTSRATIDPVGTSSAVNRVFQGAELIRIVATFVTSLFFVLQGRFRPVGQTQGLRTPGVRLSFGSQLASDED